MRWKPLLRDVVVSTALALAVSGVFAHLGASPLLLSLGVLLSAGPATDVALELIRSRNPTMVEITAAPRWVTIAAEWEDNAPGGFLNPRK